MSGHDSELNLFRTRVSCAAVLERLPAAWQLDKPGSTRRALKYRRGKGEIIIVNHDGRGWWDPLSSAKGDVFDLIQHLDPTLTFGHVRKILRPFVGVNPIFPEARRELAARYADRPVGQRWQARPRLRRKTALWCYLANERGLPGDVLALAAETDAVREGYHANAWFAHRRDGVVTHVEVRGPAFKGSLRGGTKTLFRFGRAGQGAVRLALTEAPIDAMSLAAIEGVRGDTLYLASGGGMGPGTIAAIEAELRTIALSTAALLASAADANVAGDRYAARHAELATAAGVRFERLRPTAGVDWNDVLKQRKMA